MNVIIESTIFVPILFQKSENSENPSETQRRHGVAAGRAADMHAVAIPDARFRGNDFSAAHWVLPSLDAWADALATAGD